MEQKEIAKLLLRQIKDIEVQAGKIIDGDNSAESIENIARYSKELQRFISLKIENEEIKLYGRELPDIDYSKVQFKLWHFLLLPTWFIFVYKDTIKKREIINEIHAARGKYATMEMMVKQYINTL